MYRLPTQPFRQSAKHLGRHIGQRLVREPLGLWSFSEHGDKPQRDGKIQRLNIPLRRDEFDGFPNSLQINPRADLFRIGKIRV
jgi:hypothetical protein